jgi:ribonuclease HII
MNLENKEYIIGADEVGAGPLAGPVVVCGVRAPKNWSLEGLNDSKKLSERRRLIMTDKLSKLILNKEITYHIAERSNKEIDQVGIALALKQSYVEIFHKLYDSKCQIIVDGILKFDNLGVDDYDIISIIKADTKIPAVMAASILAKTYRDGKMKSISNLYPNYCFDKNVGYGSAIHMEAIKKYGPCELHRMSYAPMKNMKKETDGQ